MFVYSSFVVCAFCSFFSSTCKLGLPPPLLASVSVSVSVIECVSVEPIWLYNWIDSCDMDNSIGISKYPYTICTYTYNIRNARIKKGLQTLHACTVYRHTTHWLVVTWTVLSGFWPHFRVRMAMLDFNQICSICEKVVRRMPKILNIAKAMQDAIKHTSLNKINWNYKNTYHCQWPFGTFIQLLQCVDFFGVFVHVLLFILCHVFVLSSAHVYLLHVYMYV